MEQGNTEERGREKELGSIGSGYWEGRGSGKQGKEWKKWGGVLEGKETKERRDGGVEERGTMERVEMGVWRKGDYGESRDGERGKGRLWKGEMQSA